MMRENNKRGTCAEEDRLSKLPESLLESILERLTVKDAAKTSILSKIWKYRWTKISALVFDKEFIKFFSKNGAFGHHGFVRIINQVLILHKGPISKFHLYIPNIFLDSFEEINQWIHLLSTKGVTEVVLFNSNRPYALPSHAFSCTELRNLKLKNCFFKPPVGFKGFLKLEKLDLINIDFGANSCGTHIKLPQLKVLALDNCTRVYNFNIQAANLKKLYVSTCPDTMVSRLLDSSRLLESVIYFRKPIEASERAEKMDLAKILSKLPRVQTFGIDGYSLKFLIAEKIPKWLPCPVNSLKNLWLHKFRLSDLHHLHGALCLLRNSPHLKFLYMMFMKVVKQKLLKDPQVDGGPTLIPLKAECTLNELQNVAITSLEGSRMQLLFIKIILAQSPSLEKFTIKPRRDSDVHERLDIAKDVLSFPRVSPKAKIIYSKPMP